MSPRPEEVSIVAGGSSFRAMKDHNRLPGLVVAVNDAAVHLGRKPDVVVSMDRLWTEYRWDRLCQLAAPFWVRTSAIKKIPPSIRPFPVHVFECDNKTCEPSNNPYIINGTNSGACAINLVLKWRPKCVWLFGFDMGRDAQGNPYWYPPYPWSPQGQTKEGKYGRWVRDLAPAVAAYREAGIELYQVNSRPVIPGVECYRLPQDSKELAWTLAQLRRK